MEKCYIYRQPDSKRVGQKVRMPISHWLFRMVWELTMDYGSWVAISVVTWSVMKPGSTTRKIPMACARNQMNNRYGLARKESDADCHSLKRIDNFETNERKYAKGLTHN